MLNSHDASNINLKNNRQQSKNHWSWEQLINPSSDIRTQSRNHQQPTLAAGSHHKREQQSVLIRWPWFVHNRFKVKLQNILDVYIQRCSLMYNIMQLVWTPCLMHKCVCVFDGTYYKITTTNYISKTSLYTTFRMYSLGPWPLKILMFALLVT